MFLYFTLTCRGGAVSHCERDVCRFDSHMEKYLALMGSKISLLSVSALTARA